MNRANPNPRIGVLLRHGNASARLRNTLWQFHMRGLNWLQKFWPEERMRKELNRYGKDASREWNAILKARGHPHHVEPLRASGLIPLWRHKETLPEHDGWFYVRMPRGFHQPPAVGIRCFDSTDKSWWLPSRQGMTSNTYFSEWLFIPEFKQSK